MDLTIDYLRPRSKRRTWVKLLYNIYTTIVKWVLYPKRLLESINSLGVNNHPSEVADIMIE